MADDSSSSRPLGQLESSASRPASQPARLPLLLPRPEEGLPSARDVIEADLWKAAPESANLGAPLPPLWADSSVEQDIYFDGHLVQQYLINGRPFTMVGKAYEDVSTYSRHTISGRYLTYSLEVVQQPEQARACGAGSKSANDRRPVDPPPVVRLNIHENGNDITFEYEATFMLYASLETERPIAYGRMQVPPAVAALTGVAVASAAYLEKPELGGYFIFPDLSVRHEGFYRLRFHLFEGTKNANDADADRLFPQSPMMELETPVAPLPHQAMANRMEVVSRPFQVFSAKKFPGLRMSTDTSRVIADQGCRVRIRRDIRQRKRPGKGKAKDEQGSQNGTPRQQSIEIDPRSRAGSIDSSMPAQEQLRRSSFDSQHERPTPMNNHEPFSRTNGLQHMAGPHMLPPLPPPSQFPSQLVQQRAMSMDLPPLPTAFPTGGSSPAAFGPIAASPIPFSPIASTPAHTTQTASSPVPSTTVPRSPVHRMSMANILDTPSHLTQLPPLERSSPYTTGDKLNPTTGQYDLPGSSSTKRTASASYLQEDPLKSGARPGHVAPSAWGNSLAGYGRDTPIVADDGDAQDDSDDDLLPGLGPGGRMNYRRADGDRGAVHAPLRRQTSGSARC